MLHNSASATAGQRSPIPFICQDRGIDVIKRIELIERLESRRLLSVSLVKDLNPSESGSNGPLPSVFDVEPVGSFTYLSAMDTTAGWEIYRTDGTEAGTTLIKDIRPGR